MTSDLRKTRKNWKPFLLKLTPARIALLYAAAGCLWIAFSDMALTALVHDVYLITLIAMMKGWLYVAVTAIILYLLIRRGEATLRESEKKFRMLADTAAAAIFIYRDSDISLCQRNVAENDRLLAGGAVTHEFLGRGPS